MSPRQILLVATTNKKKLIELQTLLWDLPLDLKTLADLPSFETVEESGKTFQENAKLKALGYASQSGYLTLGEDSGLCCEALEGAPGVYSARFSGKEATDEKNNEKLLKLFEKIPDNCRGAYYSSVVAIAKPGQLIGIAEGKVHGFIHKKLEGTGGFGYDPLFYYPPFGTTFANVLAEKKHTVSHRAQALIKTRDLLADYLQQT